MQKFSALSNTKKIAIGGGAIAVIAIIAYSLKKK
jgi:hypothetical protein